MPNLADFREFVILAIRGDLGGMTRRLDAEPGLATAIARGGATREQSGEFFFESIRHYQYGGDTALHMAAAAFQPAAMKLLLARGADCRARNRRGAEPLHYAADGNGSEQAEGIALLIDAGADPDALDKSGVAPLHRAVRKRSPAAVRALVERGANPLLMNGNGSTPLHLAVQATGAGGSGSPRAVEAQAEIIRFLIRNGASPEDKNARGRTARDTSTLAAFNVLLEFDEGRETSGARPTAG